MLERKLVLELVHPSAKPLMTNNVGDELVVVAVVSGVFCAADV